jgi:hypothetical protein
MERNHHTKTAVVPLIIAVIVVAVGATGVDFIVVPRAAAQHVFGEAQLPLLAKL